MTYNIWEADYDCVCLHAWERWTQNGLGLDTDDCDLTMKSVQNAATNAWQDGMNTSAWLHATLQALGAAQ
jgi:hypothetical protein